MTTLVHVRMYLYWLVLRVLAAFCPRDRIVLDGELYMTRYYLRGRPKGAEPSLRLQHIMCADPDRPLHDHPWHAAKSLILRGGYTEIRRVDTRDGGAGTQFTRSYGPGDVNTLLSYRSITDRHRITSVRRGGAWTLFATSARHGRGWGFTS